MALSALRRDALAYGAVIIVAVVLWLPRLEGPVDLRFDAGVYYILGTSLAQGRGYRLLSEPGSIQAVQYPPLLPAAGAAHEWATGATDPYAVGQVLRASFFLLFIAYGCAVYWMGRHYLLPSYAFFGTLLCLLNLNTVFLSDLFFTEIPFALMSVVCVALVRRGGQLASGGAGALAAASYLLRSVGIALLAAWAGEALLRRSYRTALLRASFALIPVLAWQGYTAHVKGSAAFAAPAYPYQRADYQFYNVGYLENMSYVDPNRPEQGRISPVGLLERVAVNLTGMPLDGAESISADAGFWRGNLQELNRRLAPVRFPLWAAEVGLWTLGVLIFCGLGLLAVRGEWMVPLYVGGSIVLIATTPWPGQFPRYLVPLAPFFALGLFYLVQTVQQAFARGVLRRGRRAAAAAAALVVVVIVVQQAHTLYRMFMRDHQQVSYRDAQGRERTGQLFYYDDSWRSHDDALDWLARHAERGAVIGTLTPHWAYLRTGLQAVAPPYEADVGRAQAMLDAVPVKYLVLDRIERAGVATEYARPVVRAFPDNWNLVYSAPGSGSLIYRRVQSPSRVMSRDAGS